MDLREAKALEIAARCRLTFDGTAWTVPAQSGSGPYRVTLSRNGNTCSCDDFSLRAQDCKHVLACRLVAERDGIGKAPALDTDVLPKRPTYKQDWPAYNLAQSTEKHRFQELLFDLCRGIEESESTKCGRRPHRLKDAVFAAVFKVYAGLSSRRFSCDLADAHESGYLTKCIPGMKVNVFLENPALTPILHGLIVESSKPLALVETEFAPDSSGFSVSRFVKWHDEKYAGERSGKDWVKVHLMAGTTTHIVTAVEIHDRDAADCPQFKPLFETTLKNFTVEQVAGDKAYLSHGNLELVAAHDATPYIPFKTNSTEGDRGGIWAKMFGYFQYRREEFLQHYHRRSNVESVFSMIKAKFRDHVRSRTDTAMKNEVLCKVLCHNLCVLIMAQCELGIESVFWDDGRQEEKEGEPRILKLIRNAAT